MQDRPSETPGKLRPSASPPDRAAAAGLARRLPRLPALGNLAPRKLLLLGLAGLALAYGVKLAAGWVLHGRFVVETDDAYVEADTSVIAPEITGTIAEVAVAENQPVKAGELLVRLVDAEQKARVAQAESALAAQVAGLANIDARLVWQRSMIRTADAQLMTARSDATRTTADHERYTALATAKVTSAQRYEAAKSEHEKAKAALERAAAGLEAEQQQLAVLTTQRDQGQAQIAQARAQLDLARIDLARTAIRAPVDGVVGNRGAQVGQYVRPGTQLMAIVPIPAVRVVANFKETQIATLRRGQSARITIDAFPNVEIIGRVESLSPASGSRFSLLPPENATGNFTKIVQRVPVRIAIDPANTLEGRLRPGLSVVVHIDGRQPGDGALADRLIPPPRVPAPVAIDAGGEARKR